MICCGFTFTIYIFNTSETKLNRSVSSRDWRSVISKCIRPTINLTVSRVHHEHIVLKPIYIIRNHAQVSRSLSYVMDLGIKILVLDHRIQDKDLGFKILVRDHRIYIGFSFLVLGSQDHWTYDSRSLSQIRESRIQAPCPRSQNLGFSFFVVNHRIQVSFSLSQIIESRIQDPCLRSQDLGFKILACDHMIFGYMIQDPCPRSQGLGFSIIVLDHRFRFYIARFCVIGNRTQNPDSLSKILGFRFLVLDHTFRFQVPFHSTQDSGSRFLFIAHRIQVPSSFLQHIGFRFQVPFYIQHIGFRFQVPFHITQDSVCRFLVLDHRFHLPRSLSDVDHMNQLRIQDL